MEETFSVCQFFANGSYEYFKRDVSDKEAVQAAISLSTNPAAKVGTTVRVIITDGWDCCAWEWIRGQGIVFPDALKGKLK